MSRYLERGIHTLLCFLIFENIIIIQYFTKAMEDLQHNISYNQTTKLLNASILRDPIVQQYFHKRLGKKRTKELMTEYLKDSKTALRLDSRPETLTNLYSSLENLMNNNCLIVVNNFKGIEFFPNIEYPVILRRFEVVFRHLKINNSKEAYSDLIWIPIGMLSTLDSVFSNSSPIKNCSISKYFSALNLTDSNSGHCVGLNPSRFAMAAKPWQCEVQMDLFLPSNILRMRKFTQIFRQTYHKIHFFPSLRPLVHILIDTKVSVNKYDWLSLSIWVTKKNFGNFKQDDSYYDISNDIQIIGHASCKTKYFAAATKCKITKINTIIPCSECRQLFKVESAKLNDLSFSFITFVEKAQRNMAVTTEYLTGNRERNELPGQIEYFLRNERKAILFPLKNFKRMMFKYSDKLKMLAFAYASILGSLLGNVTPNQYVKLRNSNYKKFGNLVNLHMTVLIFEFENGGRFNHFGVQNVFGKLHFISCGSRGLEAYGYFQLISVFKRNVWIFLIVFIVVLATSIMKLYNGRLRFAYLLTSLLSIVKVLLEQGNPFPANFDKTQRLRILMSGILLQV